MLDGKTLIAIDPGSKRCAVALFVGSTLVNIGEQTSFTHPGMSFARAVYELPQADGRGAPTDDLLAVAAAGATLAAWCSEEVRAYQPRQWKGSVPKPVHHRRAWAVLADHERDILGGALTSHAIDKACERGAANRWQKDGKLYYSARELPTLDGLKITHDLLDAAVLGLHDLGRLRGADRGGSAAERDTF